MLSIVAEDHLAPEQRAERGSYVGCIAGARSKAEYLAGLAAVGFADARVEFTHEAAEGMHAAVVRATKPAQPDWLTPGAAPYSSRVRSPSSSGLGHRPFKAAARVRIPLGMPSEVTSDWPDQAASTTIWGKMVFSHVFQGEARLESRLAAYLRAAW